MQGDTSGSSPEQPPGTGAALPPAGAPGADSLSQDPGLQVAYFAFKLDGPDGKPVGLFRIADDQAAQQLVMERFTPDGEWVSDPALIDDLHEPGAYSVDPSEAESIQQLILDAANPATG